jgi:hypothetical protein
MTREKCEQLLKILREDRAKNEFVCKVVEQALRSCGVDNVARSPDALSKVYNYIWDAKDIPDQDKPYAVAKIMYGSRS